MRKILITMGFIALVLYFGIKVKRKYDEIITQYDSAYMIIELTESKTV